LHRRKPISTPEDSGRISYADSAGPTERSMGGMLSGVGLVLATDENAERDRNLGARGMTNGEKE
jgi:hypothetical protein